MEKTLLEKLLNLAILSGTDFADIFYEKTRDKSIILVDKKIDNLKYRNIEGAGIRLCDGENVYYSAVNNLNEENLIKVINELSSNFNGVSKLDEVILKEEKSDTLLPKYYEEKYDEWKKNYLLNIDNIARKRDSRIIQVQATFSEMIQDVKIANTKGKLVTDRRFLTRLTVSVVACENSVKSESSYAKGSSMGYEFLDTIDIKKDIENLVDLTINKLNAKYAPSGKMPAVIGNGFGVMIHEACGHALEATSVADGVSVYSNKFNKRVANEKVTIIDDATIPGLFGTTKIDDEGNYTKKNICIENGILKSYLVDIKNASRMNHSITSSSRRQSYLFAPTSRMNNTYLASGNDSIDSMINSIEFGLYAKKMGGGQVNTITGDFNFGVDEAYVIRDGKICEMVKGASLIGNTKDILYNIEMIADDLNFDTGFCGSESGYVPVTCGQPTIKLSSILVGGKDE